MGCLFKSPVYWTAEGQKQTFGSLTIELLSEQPSSITDVIERELKVHNTAKVCKVTTLFVAVIL